MPNQVLEKTLSHPNGKRKIPSQKCSGSLGSSTHHWSSQNLSMMTSNSLDGDLELGQMSCSLSLGIPGPVPDGERKKEEQFLEGTRARKGIRGHEY